jgi:hypothetical protein
MKPLFDKHKLFEAAQKVEEPGPGESIAAGKPPRREPCTGCGGHGHRWEHVGDTAKGERTAALVGCPVCSDRNPANG